MGFEVAASIGVIERQEEQARTVVIEHIRVAFAKVRELEDAPQALHVAVAEKDRELLGLGDIAMDLPKAPLLYFIGS